MAYCSNATSQRVWCRSSRSYFQRVVFVEAVSLYYLSHSCASAQQSNPIPSGFPLLFSFFFFFCNSCYQQSAFLGTIRKAPSSSPIRHAHAQARATPRMLTMFAAIGVHLIALNDIPTIDVDTTLVGTALFATFLARFTVVTDRHPLDPSRLTGNQGVTRKRGGRRCRGRSRR